MLINYITTCLWTGTEMIAAIILFGGFSVPRLRPRTFWVTFVALLFLFSGILLFAADNLGWMKSLIGAAMFAVLYRLEFRGELLFQCQIAVIFYAILCAIDNLLFTGVLAINWYTLSILKWVSSQYLLLGGITHGLMLLVCIALRVLRKQLKVHAAAWKWYTPPMAVSTLSVAMIYYLSSCFSRKNIGEVPLFICAAFLAVVTVGAVALVTWLERISRYREEALVLQAQIQAQAENLDALNISYAEQRKYVHDFRAHINTLSALLADSRIQEAQQYMAQLQKSSMERGMLVVTHNATVDAILNQKILIARKDSIDIRFVVNDLSALKLQATDLTVIMSNLLDNAIEACRKLPIADRQIEVKALLEETFFFSVRNRSLPVLIYGDQIATTKQDAQMHGYGLKNVRAVAHRCRALFELHYEEGWFLACLDIPVSPEL